MDNTISKIQCGACGRFFVGMTIHEKHRVGDYSSWGSRHCMTEEEMRTAGMDCEKKNVRITREGKAHFEEHDVWFVIASRENMRNFFRQDKQENDEEEG